MYRGIIFSDTRSLSDCFACSREEVRDVVLWFIDRCGSCVQWELVDVSDSLYVDNIISDDWETYCDVLNDNYVGLGFDGTYNVPLFIIGGDYVIPMPKIRNPLMSCGREYLYSDMIYGYGSEVSYSTLARNFSRFAAGRLPVSEEHTLDYLKDYLEKCISLLQSSITVRGAVMTTTQTWFNASKEVMQDIPLAQISSDFVPMKDRMIVSPPLDIECKEWCEGFVHELHKTDYLVCNLHGNNAKKYPFFVGEDRDKFHPMALHPIMLKYSSPLIFNTMACYGARFIGYSINQSMLYSALINGTMLYMGSCDVALGGFSGETNFSELLMKLYNVYLNQGMPAGEALQMAKYGYYRTCHDISDDTNAMYTILEFNLFGCPLLSMKPTLPANYKPILCGRSVVMRPPSAYKPINAIPVGENAYNTEDVLDYIRRRVDNNLDIIREKVEREVYQRLGLGKDNLQNTFKLTRDDNQTGWRFVYNNALQGENMNFETYYIVDTDQQGKISRIIQTK